MSKHPRYPHPKASSRRGSESAVSDAEPSNGTHTTWVTAVVAGVSATAIGVGLTCFATLTWWFLADAGAHGSTTDAVAMGLVVWLLGLGASTTLAGVTIGVTPLFVTVVAFLVLLRTSAWVSRQHGSLTWRGLINAWLVFVATFTTLSLVGAIVLASQDLRLPSLVLGAALLAAIGGGVGLGLPQRLARERRPAAVAWLRSISAGAAIAALLVIGVAAGLVATRILLSINEMTAVLTQLELESSATVSYLLVALLFVPNLVALGVAWLLGPGFSVGVDTIVSPAQVWVEQVPPFPPLAALPDNHHVGSVGLWVMVIPLLAALWGAWVASSPRRGGQTLALDIAALHGLAVGFAGGLLTAVLAGISGGALGTGALAHIGPDWGETLVFATGVMTLGGLLGGLAATWWARRSGDLGTLTE